MTSRPRISAPPTEREGSDAFRSGAGSCAQRALTLLELLIALAVLAAMGTIAFSLLASRLDERAFESAVDTTTSQLLLARAEAQATGEPIEVLAFAGPSRIEARRFVLRRDVGSRNASAGLDDLTADVDDEAALIFESWAYRELPRDVRITRRRPADLVTSVDASPFAYDMSEPWPEDDLASVAETDEPDVIRLAIFLPDGSALLTTPAWLADDDGRSARLTVQPWTGLPEVERRVDLPREDQAEPAREDDVAAPADERRRGVTR